MAKQTDNQKDTGRALVQAKHYLAAKLDSLAEWAGATGVDPADLMRLALVEMNQQPKLRQCSKESLYLALRVCAEMGLRPSSVTGEAYLVPYALKKGGMTCVAMPGYRGYIQLAHRSEQVAMFAGDVVHEGDVCIIKKGGEPSVVHEIALKDRGALIGAYAVATLTNGMRFVEYMPLEELQKIEAHAKAQGGGAAYKTWPTQMYRKAPIRRLAKFLPIGPVARAAAIDNAAQAGFRSYRLAVDPEGAEPMPEEDVIDAEYTEPERPEGPSEVDKVVAEIAGAQSIAELNRAAAKGETFDGDDRKRILGAWNERKAALEKGG